VQGDEFDRGVCANLFRYPAWGLAQETYGEDPVHVGVMGATATRGLRQHVMACVKHYALNSIEDARFMVDVTVDDEALHEVYLPHFRAVIDAVTDAVMIAYDSVNGEGTAAGPESWRALASVGGGVRAPETVPRPAISAG
jgi:beta-glucosidase